MGVKIRQYVFYACMIGFGASLMVLSIHASVDSVFQSACWLAGAYALRKEGKKLWYFIPFLWGLLMVKEIAEFVVCAKDLYSWILLITTVASGILIILYWRQKLAGRCNKTILGTGLLIYILQEVMVTMQVTYNLIEGFQGYENPCYVMVKTYLGVLVYIVLGIVTWLQKDR